MTPQQNYHALYKSEKKKQNKEHCSDTTNGVNNVPNTVEMFYRPKALVSRPRITFTRFPNSLHD